MTSDVETALYLEARGIDPEAVQEHDLARTLPRSMAPPNGPKWASFGARPWTIGWRLIVPLFDVSGELVALRARWCALDGEGKPTQAPGGRKSLVAAGARVKGRVMADETARLLLTHDCSPVDVVISEGEIDWLCWATRQTGGDRPACFGISGGGRSGSWTPELSARVPSSSDVYVRTDPDNAGVAMAEAIENMLSHTSVWRRRMGDVA